MAKRRRLGPVDTDSAVPAGLETKSNRFGAAGDPFEPRSDRTDGKAAPIAGVAEDAAATAALRDLVDHVEAAREGGRMIIDVPLDAVDLGYLVRDRIHFDSAELESLTASIRARGQQTPIEVARLGPDRYGLISGFRRISVLRQLHRETGEARFATVQCLIRAPKQAADAYLAMVEENEIRVGLSYYERARIAARAVDQGVFETEKAALLGLYHAASRPRRSKIRSFLHIVRELEADLQFPEAISERAGLALVKALEARGVEDLRTRLAAAAVRNAEDEQAVLTAFVKGGRAKKKALTKPDAPVSPCDGVTVESHSDGSVTLRGPKVAGLQADLMVWLSAR